MDFKTYQNHARETVVYPKQLANEYLTYGLMSEIGELAEAIINDSKKDSLRELGDVMWYLVNVLWENGLVAGRTAFMSKRRDNAYLQTLQLTADASKLSDWMKKGIRDWRPLKKSEIEEMINKCFYDVEIICFFLGISFNEVLEVNVAKLSKRKEENSLHGSGDYR